MSHSLEPTAQLLSLNLKQTRFWASRTDRILLGYQTQLIQCSQLPCVRASTCARSRHVLNSCGLQHRLLSFGPSSPVCLLSEGGGGGEGSATPPRRQSAELAEHFVHFPPAHFFSTFHHLPSNLPHTLLTPSLLHASTHTAHSLHSRSPRPHLIRYLYFSIKNYVYFCRGTPV